MVIISCFYFVVFFVVNWNFVLDWVDLFIRSLYKKVLIRIYKIVKLIFNRKIILNLFINDFYFMVCLNIECIKI